MDFSAWSVELDAFTLAQSNQQFLTISVKKTVPPRGAEPSAQNSVNTEISGPSDVDSDVIKALLHLLKQSR